MNKKETWAPLCGKKYFTTVWKFRYLQGFVWKTTQAWLGNKSCNPPHVTTPIWGPQSPCIQALRKMLFGERIQWFHATGRTIRVKKNVRLQKYPDSCVNLPVAIKARLGPKLFMREGLVLTNPGHQFWYCIFRYPDSGRQGLKPLWRGVLGPVYMDVEGPR